MRDRSISPLCHRASCGQHRSRRGFTLIEVMVALAIIAVSLPALMGVVMTQADNGFAMRERTLAEWVAANEMEKLRLTFRLREEVLNGRDTGSVKFAGLEWFWRAEGKPIKGFPEMNKVTVAVSTSKEALDDKNPMANIEGYFFLER